MASSKDLFQRNKQDVKDALLITKSPVFDKLIAFALAEFAQRCPTSDQYTGANNFIGILKDLPEEVGDTPNWIEPGLHHEFTKPTRDGNQPEPQ